MPQFFKTICLLAGVIATSAVAESLSVFASGGSKGLYYPIAGSICRMVNKTNLQNKLRCSALQTPGSVANIDILRNKRAQFAIVQSDVQQNAFSGIHDFTEQGEFPELRAVFSLYTEYFTMATKVGSRITRFEDIKGRRINIGVRGSGQHEMMLKLIALSNWNLNNFRRVFEFDVAEQVQALCDNVIEVMIYTVGQPNPAITQAAKECDITFVDINNAAAKALIAEDDFYFADNIPARLYPHVNKATPTLAVHATVVTTTEVPDDIVYNLTKSVFEHLAQLKKDYPALQSLTIEEMVTKGLSAPLHIGAERYYQEQGYSLER